MPLQNIIQYNNPANFTFNGSVITFPGANAQLLNIRPPNSTFYNGFHVGFNGEYGNGVLTGTANGAPTVSGNQLHCNSGLLQYVDYAAAGNADSAQTGTIRLNYIPNYSGTPATYQVFISITQNSGSFVNGMEIYHVPGTGTLSANFYDQASVLIANTNFGVFNPTAGTSYEIELDYDLTGGNTRLFVNGIQLGATQVAFGTRNPATIGLLRLGTDYTLGFTSNFSLTNVIIFNTVQHTANFPGEIPRASETLYSTQTPSILSNAAVPMGALVNFIETAIKPPNTAIQYQVVVNGQYRWWNGAAWANSDGSYAQSNLATVINTNGPTLIVPPGANIQVNALLNSILGNATPILSSIEEDYTFGVAPPVQPPQCLVYLFLESILGSLIISNAMLNVELTQSTVISGYVVPAFKISVPFSTLGFAQVSLVSTNTTSVKYNFSITYTDAFNNQRTVLFNSAIVPTQLSASLTALTTVVNT